MSVQSSSSLWVKSRPNIYKIKVWILQDVIDLFGLRIGRHKGKNIMLSTCLRKHLCVVRYDYTRLYYCSTLLFYAENSSHEHSCHLCMIITERHKRKIQRGKEMQIAFYTISS